MNMLHNRKGFTLLELLVAMALSVIVMASIYSTYYSQQKSYIVQEQLAAMEQNLRAAMFYMERDIRMAGCDPTRKTAAGITTADATELIFSEDTDGDGTTTSVRYILNDNDGDGDDDLERNGELIAENIEVLNLVYLDRDGSDLADDGLGNVKQVGNIAKIRSVHVTVAARTGIEDPTYTDPAEGDHYRRNLLSSNIKCRNLGL